jgi:hypothetical protein
MMGSFVLSEVLRHQTGGSACVRAVKQSFDLGEWFAVYTEAPCNERLGKKDLNVMVVADHIGIPNRRFVSAT